MRPSPIRQRWLAAPIAATAAWLSAPAGALPAALAPMFATGVAVIAAAHSGPVRAAPDARLLQAAEGALPAVIESLREMVSIESGSSDLAGIARMADYVDARLRALGLAVDRIAPTRGDSRIVRGTARGDGRLKVMLIAHMDTVYEPGVLATQPFRRDGNRLYGPGIADDKGGIAVILHALALLRDTGWKDYAQLTVLFNSDEEVGSAGSGERIAELGAQHDVVLSFEPTAGKLQAKAEGVLLGAAGTALATMEVKGRASHAGAAPAQGRNALIELSHQLLQTQDVAKDIPGAQLNWTRSEAGRVNNQIPESATATADVRLTRAGAAEKLQAALTAKVAESRRVPDTEVKVTLDVRRPAFDAGEAGRALALRAQSIYAELDGRPLLLVPGTGGGTDAGFAARSGKPAVLESLGLAGWGYHARDEYIEVDSIVPRLYLAMRMLQDLAKR